MTREEIFRAITAERARQEVLHPGWPWDEGTASRSARHEVLESEVRETRTATTKHELLEELVHVAAVAVRWLEAESTVAASPSRGEEFGGE